MQGPTLRRWFLGSVEEHLPRCGNATAEAQFIHRVANIVHDWCMTATITGSGFTADGRVGFVWTGSAAIQFTYRRH